MAPETSAGAVAVSVCHALPHEVWQQALRLPAGSTVAQAVAASEFACRFPGIDPLAGGIGIFGVKCDPGRILRDGDRIEIYRPLVFDPKESRRRRARHKAAQTRRAG